MKIKKKQQHKKMRTNKRQQNNKKKRNNNKWPHPTLTIMYSRFLGMFHCDIESYRDIESYCRIHSLFKLLIVSCLAYFSQTFKSCKVLKIFSNPCRVWKFMKHGPGGFPQVPKFLKDSNLWKVFDKFSKSFTSFRVLIKHCNGLKGFYNQTCAVPGSPELKPFKHCSV